MEDDKPYWVLRGGSWYFFARFVRVAFRGWHASADRYSTLGLRLFLFVSDLELLASPTKELSDGRR